MKKLIVLLAAVAMVLGMTLYAQAALVTLTFEEAWVTPGPTTTRYDGSQIDDEYTIPYGVTWVDTVADDPNLLTGQGVTLPSEFSGGWSDSDAMLWYYGPGSGGTTPFTAPILLSTPADYFSFEYRRPNAGGTMDVQLYLGDAVIYDDPGLTWDPITDGDWKTYEYTGGLSFDKVVLSGNDKFCTDTYTFNTVPIPPSFWLFATGLIPMLRFASLRKK